MPQIKRDKYTLSQSTNKEIPTSGGSIKIDIKATPKVDIIITTLMGTVSDSNGNPISNAIVSVLNGNYKTLVYTITDSIGNYSIQNLPLNSSYNILCSASGKKLSSATSFTLSSGEAKTINFTLYDEPLSNLGVITGKARDFTSNIPIKGAVASLYKIVNGASTLSSISYTNNYGQFIFENVPNGSYEVKLTSLGYNQKTIPTSITGASSIVSLSDTLIPGDNTSNSGSASGILNDSSNNPINKANIILYKIENSGDFAPIFLTKTNSLGEYSFNNIPTGNYKIMYKNTTLSNITIPSIGNLSASYPAPLIDKITIAQSTINNPLVYSVTSGLTSNGATIDFEKGYARNIGLNSSGKDGTYFLPIFPDISGMYKLTIKYLSGDAPRNLNIVINGIPSSSTPYLLPKTNSWNESDAKYFNAFINLPSTSNLVAFHGTSSSAAPDISDIAFSIMPIEFNVSPSNFTLKNSAVLSSTTPNTVTYIGGPNGGACSFSEELTLDGLYKLSIKYISGDSNRTLRIKVNGIDTGLVYSFLKTNSWNLEDELTKTIDLNLNFGLNSIEFIGDGNNYAPDITNVTLKQEQMNINLEAEYATLSGSAFAVNGMVNGLGSSSNGALTFTANAPFNGEYDIGISYASTESKSLLVDVNNTQISGSPFTTNSTGGVSTANTSLLYVKTTLQKGSNTIKIYR